MKWPLKICALAMLAVSAASCASSYDTSSRDDGYRESRGGAVYRDRDDRDRDYRDGRDRGRSDQDDQRWRDRYSRTYSYNDDTFYQQCRDGPDPAAVISGGLIGGLAGNVVGHDGSKTGATIAGVVVGAAIGAALTNDMDCEDRSYAYRSYYDGLNSNRANRDYDWRNDRSGNKGRFRVDHYYYDQDGFRCAEYRQTIYVRGRERQTKGHACQQPNGYWAVID
ncbi:MAG: hypothetical protein ABWZ40_01245 [Caulobacterales bacterium]